MSVRLAQLQRLKLSRHPLVQSFLAHTFLRATYTLPRRTEIVLEGLENIPRDRTVFFAMNHTDRYNYWPFQWGLWKRGYRFTATWVKGKYFENPWMSRFMIATNNIPLPSRGYVIATQFRDEIGRVPAAPEYRVLRDLADGVASTSGDGGADVVRFVAGGGLVRFEEAFNAMIGEVTRLTRGALEELGHDVLVFPEGTRSLRLQKGHTGLAQMTQHLGATIIPVGCNGSDKLYPGGSPWSKGGRVVYRLGPPMPVDGPELAEFRVRAPFQPLSLAASRAHGDAFRAITDRVMSRIESLLDEPYRPGEAAVTRDMDRLL